VLAVKGERKEESGESSRYHLKEIEGSRFVRLFKLPAFVDHEKASAVHKNGLLTISFMKREEAKSRRISIDVQ
jgi:HSP20 family protein